MPINRRDLFKGAGAFLGAATAYKASDAGVLLPYDKIITAPVPPWAGRTQVIAFEGAVSSYHINAEADYPLRASLDGKVIGAPAISSWNFDIEFYGDDVPFTSILTSGIYVQIFQRMD